MIGFDAPLSCREFMTHEDVPLAAVFHEVLTFLAGRSDAVLFGAQAVNAYCATERMTHDIDVLSTDAAGLAADLRACLAERFHLAMRVREVVEAKGFRVYQLRQPTNRHLVDVRQVDVGLGIGESRLEAAGTRTIDAATVFGGGWNWREGRGTSPAKVRLGIGEVAVFVD